MQVRIEIQTIPQPFPAGTVGGDWRYSVYDQSNILVEERLSPSPSNNFDLSAGENYRVDVVRLNANGELLGSIKSATFDVRDTTPVEVLVADVLVVTQFT